MRAGWGVGSEGSWRFTPGPAFGDAPPQGGREGKASLRSARLQSDAGPQRERRSSSFALLSLALLALLCLPACKKAAKTGATDGTSNSSGGNPPGNADNTGGGTNPPTRPALPTGWREFKHPDGAFSIFVPGEPKQAPMSSPSLKLHQPLGPAEARESHYVILPTAKQPYLSR